MGQRVASADRVERRHQKRAPREAPGQESAPDVTCKGQQQPQKKSDVELDKATNRGKSLEVGATKLKLYIQTVRLSRDRMLGWEDSVGSQAPFRKLEKDMREHKLTVDNMKKDQVPWESGRVGYV